MKLNEGAAYIWGAVKSIATPDDSTLVFQLKYAAPLDSIASSAYGAYIYDTKAAARKRGQVVRRGPRRGHRPVRASRTWNKGADVELRLKRVRGLLGGLERRPLHERGLPVRPAGHHRGRSCCSPASARSPASSTRSSSSPSSRRPGWRSRAGPVVREPARDAEHRVRAAQGRARPPGRADAIDYNGVVTALKGAAVPALGLRPGGPGRATPRDRPRSRTRRRPSSCSSRPATGRAARSSR